MMHRSCSSILLGIVLILCAPMMTLAQVSNNYNNPVDSVNSGGGEGAKSNNYQLNDTIGQPLAGESDTENYLLQSGYRSTSTDPSISVSCTDTLDLGTVTIGSSAIAETTCTVHTNSDTGYTLKWRIPTGSGGTNTGSLISHLNTVIPPLSPATSDTPETFTSVSSEDVRFAARLRSSSTDTAVEWGTDSVSEKWLNIATAYRSIVSRNSFTLPEGSSQIIQVKVIVGADNHTTATQYSTQILVTAYAN